MTASRFRSSAANSPPSDEVVTRPTRPALPPGPWLPLLLLLTSTACVFSFEVLTTASDGGADAGAFDAGPSGAFSLSASDEHTCLVRGGPLWCWGTNAEGRLGDGTTTDALAPVQVGSDQTWVMVSAGTVHTCALKAEGSVWCWGGNGAGQLGQGDTTSRTTPTRVALPQGATMVQSRQSFSCAVLRDASLWCWGANFEGQLGLDDGLSTSDHLSPGPVVGNASWAAVTTGQGHACGLQTDGSLWCWGRNTAAMLGLSVDAGVQLRAPQQVGVDRDWASVDANQEYTCALKSDRSLWCWGDLASSTTPTLQPTRFLSGNWQRVEANLFHGCALSLSGAGTCWGRNVEGQLGLGDNVDRPTPTALLEGPLSTISTGRFHSCQRRASGSVWCTGANQQGQLGLGDRVRRNVWTQVTLP